MAHRGHATGPVRAGGGQEDAEHLDITLFTFGERAAGEWDVSAHETRYRSPPPRPTVPCADAPGFASAEWLLPEQSGYYQPLVVAVADRPGNSAWTDRGYGRYVDDLESSVDRVAAATGFSGVVRVDRGGRVERQGIRFGAPRLSHTQHGRHEVRSRHGTKGLTSLAIMSLIEQGRLDLDTTARSVLGEDLPLIHDDVTVEHLLAHRSGIGDYFDEDVVESMTDYVLPIPVHRLATTPDYLAVLGGHAQRFPPGERFAYNNGGFVVLALIGERAGGCPFPNWCGRACANRPTCATPSSCAWTSRASALPSATSTATACGPTSCICRSVAAGTAAPTPPRRTSTHCGRPLCRPDRAAGPVGGHGAPQSDVPSESMRHGLGFSAPDGRCGDSGRC